MVSSAVCRLQYPDHSRHPGAGMGCRRLGKRTGEVRITVFEEFTVKGAETWGW